MNASSNSSNRKSTGPYREQSRVSKGRLIAEAKSGLAVVADLLAQASILENDNQIARKLAKLSRLALLASSPLAEISRSVRG